MNLKSICSQEINGTLIWGLHVLQKGMACKLRKNLILYKPHHFLQTPEKRRYMVNIFYTSILTSSAFRKQKWDKVQFITHPPSYFIWHSFHFGPSQEVWSLYNWETNFSSFPILLSSKVPSYIWKWLRTCESRDACHNKKWEWAIKNCQDKGEPKYIYI